MWNVIKQLAASKKFFLAILPGMILLTMAANSVRKDGFRISFFSLKQNHNFLGHCAGN